MAAIFEAVTEEDALKAIAETFSDNVQATLNGLPLPRPIIDKAVLAMRPSPNGGLKVVWKEKTEAPKDCSNRVQYSIVTLLKSQMMTSHYCRPAPLVDFTISLACSSQIPKQRK